MTGVVGVLLAAGRGERFGGDKLRAPVPPSAGLHCGGGNANRGDPTEAGGGGAAAAGPPGECVGVAAARALLAAVPTVVAVVRADDDALAHALGAAGATIVRCADAGRGMGASLACGVRAVRSRHPGAAGVIVALADMPWVRSATIARVAAAVAAGATVAAPFHAARRGHPVGFGAACFGELEALDGDDGARSVVAAHADAVLRLDVDDAGVLRDVDTAADLTA
jgi:molybdenum cofactor cytidylyltransferase